MEEKIILKKCNYPDNCEDFGTENCVENCSEQNRKARNKIWLKYDILIGKKIKCIECKETFLYEEPEHYEDTDCMPDGYVTDKGWVCANCRED